MCDAVLTEGEQEISRKCYRQAYLTLQDALPNVRIKILEDISKSISGIGIEDHDYLKLMIANAYSDAYIESNDYQSIIKWNKETLRFLDHLMDKGLISPNSPCVTMKKCRLGKAKLNIGRKDEARKLFQEAYQGIEISHGEDSSVAKQILLYIRECSS